MANTNHDHLGKLITYAAGLEATHAVLVAEIFRPEHRSALQWLNANREDFVMRDFELIHGRCECGAVRYEVSAPANELYHCHCSRCRRLHGALFATYACIAKTDLDIKQGSDDLKTYFSPLASWRFCGNCGCHLFAEHQQNLEVMWFMAATLDDDSHPGHPPTSEKHIFVGSKAPIETIDGDLPQYDAYAPPEDSVTSRKTLSKGDR